jgi:sulfofructose kinase
MAREFASYGVDAHAFRRLAGFRSSQSAIVVDARGERLIVTHLGDAPDDASWLPLDEVRGAGRRPRRRALARRRDRAVRRRARGGRAVGARRRRRRRRRDRRARVARRPRRVLRARARALGVAAGRCGHGRARRRARARLVVDAAGAVACAVTCGELGSWWLTRGGTFHVPAPAIEAVDTLGAGDVFHGAYALALAEGLDVGAAARFATIAAAIKCTREWRARGVPDPRRRGEVRGTGMKRVLGCRSLPPRAIRREAPCTLAAPGTPSMRWSR